MKTIGFICVAVVLASSVKAGERPEERSYLDGFFRQQVEPILQRRCFECHSHQRKVEGGLALDSSDGWQTGGENGPAVKPGSLDESPLVHAIRSLDKNSAMPPKKKLPPVEIAMLETWVMLGAPDPRVKVRGRR